MLERKLADRRGVPESNEEFLRSCGLRVGLSRDIWTDAGRIPELVNGTNQMTFTKRRLEADDLETLLASPDFETGSVRVRDRYGDYGVCGLYPVSLTDGALTDFLFSSRVLFDLLGQELWTKPRSGSPDD
jgi:predicted enzyme involved in methoxymalonyl-ACP biosynthesis